MGTQKAVVQRMIFIEEVQDEIGKLPQPSAIDQFDIDQESDINSFQNEIVEERANQVEKE